MSKEPTDVMIRADLTTDPAKADHEAGTAIGAVAGGVLGDLAHHEVRKNIEQQAFDTIPFGAAGRIVAYPRSPVRRVATADTKAMTAADRTVQAARADSADAQARHGQLEGQDSQGNPAARASLARGPGGHRPRRTACPCVDRGAGNPPSTGGRGCHPGESVRAESCGP
jgi:hypothetical protein